MRTPAWTFLPCFYPEVLATERAPRVFWRHAAIIATLPLLTLLPFVQAWTGLTPLACTTAILVHLGMYASQVYLRLSDRIGVVFHTTFAITVNVLVTTFICAIPGRLTLPLWGLYFLYVLIAARVGPPSVYVTGLVAGAPWLTLLPWSLQGASDVAQTVVTQTTVAQTTVAQTTVAQTTVAQTTVALADVVPSLGSISLLAGITYAFLAPNFWMHRVGQLAHEEDRLRRAREEQKRRIIDDLHDSVGSALAEVALWQDLGRNGQGEDAEVALDRAQRRLREAMLELRAAVTLLGDDVVESTTFEALLRSRLEGLCAAAGVVLEMESQGARGLEGTMARELFRLAEEAASNAVRHGQPTRLSIRCGWDEEVALTVEDDGQGFDVEAPPTGNGLAAMRRRAAALGGTLAIRSRPGGGTTIALGVRMP